MRRQEEKRVKDVTKQLKGVEVNNNGETMMDVGGMVTPRELERSDSNVNRGTVGKLGQMMAQDEAVGICAWCQKGEVDHPKKSKQEGGKWVGCNNCVRWFWSLCVRSNSADEYFKCPFAWTPRPGWTQVQFQLFASTYTVQRTDNH